MRFNIKNKNLFESIKHALNGIKLAFKSEKNLKKYIVIAIIFGVLNILTKSTYIDAIFYIILCFIVFAFEYINTAIERVVDKFILKIDENAKYIKDVSASAVLTSGLLFFIVEGIIIVKNIIALGR